MQREVRCELALRRAAHGAGAVIVAAPPPATPAPAVVQRPDQVSVVARLEERDQLDVADPAIAVGIDHDDERLPWLDALHHPAHHSRASSGGFHPAVVGVHGELRLADRFVTVVVVGARGMLELLQRQRGRLVDLEVHGDDPLAAHAIHHGLHVPAARPTALARLEVGGRDHAVAVAVEPVEVPARAIVLRRGDPGVHVGVVLLGQVHPDGVCILVELHRCSHLAHGGLGGCGLLAA